MKHQRKLYERLNLALVVIAVLCAPINAQTRLPSTAASTSPIPAQSLTPTTRSEVAEKFAKILDAEYAYADKGAQMADAVRAKLKSGEYDKLSSPAEFAAALEVDARAVTHDKHLRVSYAGSKGPRMIMRQGQPSAEAIAQMRRQNAAIPEVKILEGNIGYLPVDGMLPAQAANDAIAAAFAFLHNTDALIIDLRKNPGGSGYAEVYLSYLSEGAPYVTGSAHWRKDNRVQEFKTTDVGAASYGAKKPVFVLTSHRTFSAAEGLAYEVQAFKRGLLVGETTGGGANPSAGGATTDLGHGFSANVPTGYVVSAATGTNWEGNGVKPDIEIPAPEALGKAWSMAAAGLKATAASPESRDILDALAQAKLAGPSSIDPKDLAGEYHMTGGRMIVMGGVVNALSVKEKAGSLFAQTEDGEIPLLPVGGDRYSPRDLPGGFSVIFFRRNGRPCLLKSNGTSSFLLEKLP